jgi:hypothetical protein
MSTEYLKAYVIDIDDNDQRRLCLRCQKRFVFPPNQQAPDVQCRSLVLQIGISTHAGDRPQARESGARAKDGLPPQMPPLALPPALSLPALHSPLRSPAHPILAPSQTQNTYTVSPCKLCTPALPQCFA